MDIIAFTIREWFLLGFVLVLFGLLLFAILRISKIKPRIKARARQIKPTHHKVEFGVVLKKLNIKQIIPTPAKKKTTAVATWSEAKRIRKIAIAPITKTKEILGVCLC